MENHIADQTMTLSMNISCCEGCPKTLKKKLLKMPGVESVAIDTGNNLVSVTGTVDPTSLLNNVARLGKAVQLLPTDYTRTQGRDNHFCADQRKGNMHRNCCCQDNRHRREKKLEEEHQCEAYVPPKVDPRVCRDFYCKVHLPMHKIVNRVPPESSTVFGIGRLPFDGPCGGCSYMYPRWYGEEPPRLRRMLPQRPFGFRY